MANFKARPDQQGIIQFTGGKMGIAAVPGSGKTHTLSFLAARLITQNYLLDNQEILVVTLANSAVKNFSSRISGFITESGLLPGLGYRVRTLHGLAHDIVRERPELAGLSSDFIITSERETNEILDEIVQTWLRSHPEIKSQFTNPDQNLLDVQVRKSWQETATSIANSFIRQAKDLEVTPLHIQELLKKHNLSDSLLEMGKDIYFDYQRALNYRNAVDFDDLIRLALRVLKSDPEYLQRLQFRWPYILEDEAQDSSRLQEEILRLLSGEHGNWVRVGDPNQAIYETFTTAHPKYLRNFLKEPGISSFKLTYSGRSTASIIKLANHLVHWSCQEHPVEELRNALFPSFIEVTPPDDPQPNPPDNLTSIFVYSKKLSPEKEISLVIKSLQRWLSHDENKDKTIAVLVPRNERGAKIVEQLKENNIDYIELLRSSRSTRQNTGILASILRYLAEPNSTQKITNAYNHLRQNELEKNPSNKEIIKLAEKYLKKCTFLEDYLWPQFDKDWLQLSINRIPESNIAASLYEELNNFRRLICRWQNASLLSPGQVILTIGQDIFSQPTELALTHKLALLVERIERVHPDWNLTEFAMELDSIAKNEQKFLGFDDEDTGFDPDLYKGKVVVATIHKAKGLEWDKIYLLSVNNYDFPSALPSDSFVAEKYFIKDKINLQAVALYKLNALVQENIPAIFFDENEISSKAREEYAAERLRLLYVGITRARKEIIMTWNTGQRGDCQPALPFIELENFVKENFHVSAS